MAFSSTTAIDIAVDVIALHDIMRGDFLTTHPQCYEVRVLSVGGLFSFFLQDERSPLFLGGVVGGFLCNN